MKFNFEDYKKFCAKRNLKEGYYTSLALFKKTCEMQKELRLIERHLNKLKSISVKTSVENLVGGGF